MKSKHKRRSSSTKVVRKPQVSHQGVIFRDIPAPASPSSKNCLVADMEKQLSKKKKRRVILTSESTTDEGETIPETPKAVLIKASSHMDTSVITPPKVLLAKTVTVEARTSDIPINISDMDTNVIMGEDDSNKATKLTTFAKLYENMSPQLSQLSTNDNKNFMEVFALLKELKSLSSKSTASMLSSEDLIQNLLSLKSYLSNT
ncbi:unnamed protein product [Lactuca saligna]|uniref:Uncharacterized protein n=1 Tax=Lactuca saligna TaxID=75948 RepID=A0AA35VZ60_LACSI|nr:unnamed protein product [Lactuca saligna]